MNSDERRAHERTNGQSKIKLPIYDLNEPLSGDRPLTKILAKHFGTNRCYPYDCYLWFKDAGVVVWTGPHAGVIAPKGCRDQYSHESRAIRQIIYDALNTPPPNCER